jgi:hypothetical protein
MIVFPIFFQQALEIRLKLVAKEMVHSHLTFATSYRPVTPNYVYMEGGALNDREGTFSHTLNMYMIKFDLHADCSSRD